MDEISVTKGRGSLASLLVSKTLVIAICVAMSLVSFFVLANYFSSVERYGHEIEVLDTQKRRAAELSIASATASTVLTAIPDDIANPAANQLATISKDLALVTGAVLLEKYLLTILGFALFRWLVPICSIAILISNLLPLGPQARRTIVEGAVKVLIVGVIAWRAVPISVVFIDKINETYDETIELAIESANNVSSAAGVEQDEEPTEEEQTESGNAIDQIGRAATAAGTFVADTVGSITESITAGAGKLLGLAKVTLTRVTEGFAVLVVTSCVIPILTPLALFNLVKMFFQPSSSIAMPPALLPHAMRKRDTMDSQREELDSIEG